MAKFNKVIVVGSGIGGLCAAAAMSRHAQEVKVYCKDVRPERPLTRKTVPQGSHISILLQAGLQNLEALFPGIHELLIENGAAQIQAGSGQQIHIDNRWLYERDLELTLCGLSRPFLEHFVYQKASEIDAISIENGVTVSQLNFSDNLDVTGISGLTASGEEFSESADLVIDSSGQSGKLIRQVIEKTGEEIDAEVRDIGIFYSTLFLKKPPAFVGKGENILIVPEPENGPIGGSLVDVENDVWCVSLHGRDQATPPKNLSEWQLMAQQLPDSRIWERVKDAEPVDELRTFKKPQAYWRHFESAILPKGYLPLGDVVNSLNPILGQGMTVAIGHATALGKAFDEKDGQSESAESAYLKEAADWSSRAWQTTKAYEKKYSAAAAQSENKIMQQLTDRHHQQIKESAEYHLQQVLKTQMLVK